MINFGESESMDSDEFIGEIYIIFFKEFENECKWIWKWNLWKVVNELMDDVIH